MPTVTLTPTHLAVIDNYSSNWSTSANGTGSNKSLQVYPFLYSSYYRVSSSQNIVSLGIIRFNTTSIPLEASVTSVRLIVNLYVNPGYSTLQDEFILYSHPWDGSTHISNFTTIWRTPSQLSTEPVVASLNRPNFNAQGVDDYLTLPNDVVNKQGYTSFMSTNNMHLAVPNITTNGRGLGIFAQSPRLEITYSTGFDHLDTSSSGLKIAGSGSGYYLERSGAGLIRKAGTEGTGALIYDANGNIVSKA